MGEVRANVLLRNYISVGSAKRGYISEKDIETSELEMTVDTGAVMILLPQDEVEKLGLYRCIDTLKQILNQDPESSSGLKVQDDGNVSSE